MSTSVTYHFPSEASVNKYLRDVPLLAIAPLQKLGITKAIVDVAAARFANLNKTEWEIQDETMKMIKELKALENNYAKKDLPKLDKWGYGTIFSTAWWLQITLITGTALVNCAKNYTEECNEAANKPLRLISKL